MAEALYRKYRPQVFEDVVGQEPIQRTLKNAISQDKVSHAYLFCGPRGTGKTTTARLLAKALLCKKGPTPDPDGTCEDCWMIADGTHPDVYELDAASRTGVENVREEIISRVHFAPTRGRYKVYIIDEVHMLSTAAFNALLKTLEEPPSHVVFILCTTDPQKVPETIHSRCQRFDFHRISPESMVGRLGAICLAEDVEFEGEALDLIAQRADGGLRNALTSLEQIIAFENGKVTLAGAERLLGSIDSNDLAEIMAYVGRRDIANCFRWTAAYVETGADLANFVRDMAEHVRNLYILALVGDDAELDVTETCRHELVGELSWFGPDRASRLLGVLGDLIAELKTTSNPRLAFEVALTRMVRPDSDLTIESLAERVEALESGYSAVAHVLPGAPAPAPEPEPAPVEAEPIPSVGVGFASPSPMAAGAAADLRPEAEDGQGGFDSTAPAPDAAPRAQQAASAQMAQPDVASAGQAAQRDAGSKLASLANPAALQRVWQATLATVKKQKAAYGVLFMGTKALFDDASETLVIQFPNENTFAFGAVQKPDVQDALSEALAKAVGADVPFRYEQMKPSQVAAPASQPAVQRAVDPQPARTQAQPAATPRPEPAPAQAQPVQERPVSAQVQVQPAQAAQSSAQVQSPQAQPAPATAQPAPSSQPQPQPQPAPSPQPQPQPQPAPAPVEEAFYEQVPYEDVYYEPVPYDEFDLAESQPARSRDPQGSSSPAVANAPASEDAAEIQALLQASFGEGVVLSETDG